MNEFSYFDLMIPFLKNLKILDIDWVHSMMKNSEKQLLFKIMKLMSKEEYLPMLNEIKIKKLQYKSDKCNFWMKFEQVHNCKMFYD